MSEITKRYILTGINHAKELLFFCIGVATLISIPFLEADRVGTFQLLVIGTILTLEGFSTLTDMVLTFAITKGLPWIDNQRNRIKKRRT